MTLIRQFFIRTMFVASLLMAQSANAAVITGTIYHEGTGSPVDHLFFRVNTAGTVTIDVLSWETDLAGLVTNDPINEPVDINGDGEIAFIDSVIYLFSADGSSDPGAGYIAFNDDYALPEGFTDGSIHRYDSYLALGLFPGDYMLAIGAFNLNPEDAIFGFNNYSDNLPYSCNTDRDGNCRYVANYHHGDYQVTLTGDVTISAVPVPPAMWLFGSGLIGLIGICRRRKFLLRTL